MARGSKKKYTSKQKRKASKIEKGYKKRGVSSKEAERRAWATVNKSDKGGRKKGGGGRGKSGVSQVPARAEEKAVGSKAYLTSIATAATNISAAVSPAITRDNQELGCAESACDRTKLAEHRLREMAQAGHTKMCA